jgi:hypothetical protein
MSSNGNSCVDLMRGTLVRPIARYPSNIAGDASLKVAENQVETTLNMAAGSGDTIFRVSDASRLVVDMLLTIDNEIVSVSSIDPATNNITVVRGFDGTIASPHNPGRVLRAYIDAWHHNALAAEITAIESALGPNLANVSSAGGPAILSSNYRWQRVPGGTLVAGLNVVTLTPVPKGVNGTNTYHYLYVSGGTGAAEACLISGGTAVAGAASGTVFITCANAHSGAWTIGTSSDGIQEAIWSLPKDAGGAEGGVINLPPGMLPIYKGFAIPKGAVTVQGQGTYATVLDLRAMGTGYACWMTGAGGSNWLSGFTIKGPAPAMAASEFAVVMQDQNSSGLNDIDIALVPNGVKVTGSSTYRIWLQYMGTGYLTGTGGTGILIEGGADHFLSYIAHSDSDNNDLAAIRIRNSGGTTIDTVDCLGAGLLIDPDGSSSQTVAWVFLRGAMFDSTQNEAMKMAPVNGGRVIGVVASNSWFASSITKDGVRIEAAVPNRVEYVSFTGMRLVKNAKHGIAIVGNGIRAVTISASLIMENNTAGGSNGIHVQDASDLIFTGNQIATPTGGVSKHEIGIMFAGGPSDNIVVSDNIIKDFNSSPIGGLEFVTGLNRLFSNNLPTSNTLITGPAATTLNLTGTPFEQFQLTGTVPVQTITPVWYGRKITLVFSDAAPGGVVGGGNIKKTRAVTQNGMLWMQYDVGGWNVIGP